MADVNVTVVGYAGNDPTLKHSKSGLTWTSFSVGSTRSWRDAETGQWMDAPTIWFSVRVWGHKAQNVVDSIRKGTPVVVTGRLSQESYVVSKQGENGELISEQRAGFAIENATVAVDLSRGTAKYYRTDRDVAEPAEVPGWVRASGAPGAAPIPPSLDEVLDASEGWVPNTVEELEEELVPV